jgi:hypothetical protein
MRTARRLASDPPEINLIPLLDMVSLLIQLLLVNAQFGVFAQISTAIGAPSDQPQEGLQLQVGVSPQGFAVSWTEAGGRKEKTLPCASGACSAPESYDAAGLQGLAAEIKRAHPGDASVQLVLGQDVSFEVIARAMDALRGTTDTPMFPDVVLGSG